MKIKDLLHFYNRHIIKKDFLFKEIINILNDNTGILLPENTITIEKNTLKIKTKPIYKENILLKKEQLLILLKEYDIFDIQ
jgi:hypothetical protein